MKRSSVPAVLLGTAMAISCGFAYAGGKADVGKREYNNNCAVCHGLSGKGNGPLAAIVETRIPDLTTLAARNGGVFPMEHVYDTIDSGVAVKAHGTREMPVWGSYYRAESGEHYADVEAEYNQAVVRARILSLAEYIYRLQGK